MLKRISPSQAELGMFVHKLEGPWLKHPFWRSKFVLSDAETLSDLRESEIDAVVIDISKGRDLAPPRPAAMAPAPTRLPPGAPQRRTFVPPSQPAAFDYRSTAPQTTAREFGHAGQIAHRGRKAISKVFLQARLGNSIKAEMVEPVIEDIFASIQRNPHAFNGLMRCKRDNEYVYRHALACSALMISLGRQLKLSPSELREAGLAGLLFDVGINHLPVDLAASGGDFRSVPQAILAQHTRLGHDFLMASGMSETVALTALQHHERNDGSGYHEGLLGGDIPLLSRMAAVCDAYDELASGGNGAAPVDPGAVLEQMARMPGKFDPVVFAAFVQTIGTFPIGTFVELKSERLAMVIDQHPSDYSTPKVRTFFSLLAGETVRQEEIDLANCYGADAIFGLADLSRFEAEEVLELRQRMLATVMRRG
jgi:HD-GYP domain-containing protein (c-di-GMP phosphodiesterase class II)